MDENKTLGILDFGKQTCNNLYFDFDGRRALGECRDLEALLLAECCVDEISTDVEAPVSMGSSMLLSPLAAGLAAAIASWCL